jgi:GNAT superfamily N-acetyltransferase
MRAAVKTRNRRGATEILTDDTVRFWLVNVNSDETIAFRSACSGDVESLTGLCRAAKAHWGYPAEWLAAWRDDLTITPEYIATGWVGVAEIAGETVGFYGLKLDQGVWYLEHLWLQPVWMGRGLGRKLFSEAVCAARACGATELRIKSDPNAEAFYLKLGAIRSHVETYWLLGTVRRDLPHLRFTH